MYEDFRFSTNQLKGHATVQEKEDEWVELSGGSHIDGAYTINLNEIPQEETKEIKFDLTKLYWYKAEILKLYAELGTYQKVADLTKIPMSSIYKTIQETRQELKKQIA